MKKEITVEGPSVAEALDMALDQLGVQQDAVEYEVIEEGGKRMFGLGADKIAKVSVRIKQDVLRQMEADGEPDEGAFEPHETGPGRQEHSSFTREPADLTPEEMDQVADEAVSSTQSILQGFGIEASIDEYEGDDGEIILDVVGSDLGVLIGRHGRTLDSIQTLVSAITNRRLGFRYPVLVDVEGYRNRRREKLEEIARRSADRAARQGIDVRLRPMSSYERKVIHMYLRADARIETASEGEEPFRQVVVIPKKR